MSSLKHAIPKRPYKERSQPTSRKKFGLLEKRKDYQQRAAAFHKKEDALRRLKEKAANRNPDEFNFGMIRTKTVNGIHKTESVANKYTPEELLLMKTQDMAYVLQKIQSEKKKVEKLKAELQCLDKQPLKKHVYFAQDSEEANEILSRTQKSEELPISAFIPDSVKRKMDSSYRELEARIKRVEDLERVYAEMALQKELQKKGKKRKLREDEIVIPTERPVYKWKAERKR